MSIIVLNFFSFGCQKEEQITCVDGEGTLSFTEQMIGCCFYNDSSYVFDNDSVYQSKLSQLNSNLPTINFSNSTLIGKYIEGQCKESCYTLKTICKDETNKLLTIKVKRSDTNGCQCKKEVDMMFWAIIPKQTGSYQLKIEIK